MSEYIKEINASQFEAEVLHGGKVAVDFYSDECAPCAALAPKYESLAELYGQDVRFVKIFRQKNRELAASLDVRSSPTVLFYDGGKRVGDMLSGGVKRSDMARNLDAIVGGSRAAEVHGKMAKTRTECDILIVGGGPAGLAAAIYAAQAKKNVIVVDPKLPGGQVSTTHQVSNYPGFEQPISGYMLGHHMSEQAKAAGAKFRAAVDVTDLDLRSKSLEVDGLETIVGRKLVLAMGSSPRLLGVPGEVELKGQGVSYCATCDAKYMEGREVVVIGGGNSAVEEALFIAGFATKVTIVHQFDKLQANEEAQAKAKAHPKIQFLFSHEPRLFEKTSDGMRTVVEDLKSKERKVLESGGVFIFVGMVPNLALLGGDDIEKDQYGYLKTDATMKLAVPDVFAVGDIASKPFRQITIAVADGTIAAIQASRELS